MKSQAPELEFFLEVKIMYELKIAEKLVELRTSMGVTQEDVAASLSISNKTISKWENGTSMPDLPMLVELAGYYGVSTDALLGLAPEKKQTVQEEVYASFEGLDRKECVLKAFEATRAIIPAIFGTIKNYGDSEYDNENLLPEKTSRYYRNNISLHEFFEFVAGSEDVNVAVMMLRNKANFAWMNDPEKQKKTVKLFRFLSNEDALSVLYFIHSTACSESFTADYIASNTGVSEERVREILDEFCTVGDCTAFTAQLTEGETTVYEFFGDGIILSLITLAYERMCGKKCYDYNYNGRCKMIRG